MKIKRQTRRHEKGRGLKGRELWYEYLASLDKLLKRRKLLLERNRLAHEGVVEASSSKQRHISVRPVVRQKANRTAYITSISSI